MAASSIAATTEGYKYSRLGRRAPSGLTSSRRDRYGRGTISVVSGSSDANEKG